MNKIDFTENNLFITKIRLIHSIELNCDTTINKYVVKCIISIPPLSIVKKMNEKHLVV